MKPENKKTLATDWPAYWFVALERAIEEGDYEKAAEAQRNLKRLGVTVRFEREMKVAHA